MKKTLLLALVIAACCAVSPVVKAENAADGPKYKEVYVNLDTVWRSSAQGKEDLQKINELVETSKAQVDKLKEEMKAFDDEFKAATTDDQKKEIIQKAEKKRRELVEVTTISNRQIEQERAKAQQAFVETIIPIINQYRNDKGYLVIHRFTPNEVISVHPDVDITEEILTIYNK